MNTKVAQKVEQVEPEAATLRDQYAMHAMSGMVSGCRASGRHFDPKELMDEAFALADAAMDARKKEPK